MPPESAGLVRRIEITERVKPVFEGEVFGAVGQYERLTGSVYGAINPAHRLNADISNLVHAPRDESGWVPYRADLCIVKPVNLERGNDWLFYEIVNRGTKRAFQRICGGPQNNWPQSLADTGNAFLLRQGYSIVWSGWQGDVIRDGGRMAADLPVARYENGPIKGLCREEFILDARNTVREDTNEPIVELSEGLFVAPLHYPAADQNDPGSLTIRARETDPRLCPVDLKWRFIDPKHIEISCPAGYDRGALYEFIYLARDPIVLGIGVAGIRDLVSFLRYATQDQAGTPNPLLRSNGKPPSHAMGFGLSQSGRVLREFLYVGMNQDCRGRRVFDGVLPAVTGARRAVIMSAFCQGTRYSRSHEDHLYPGDQFPFTYAPLHDPVSGRTEGILDRATEANVRPKVLHLDTDSEIWSGRASLVTTDCYGADIEQPQDVRIYLASGVPHGPFALPETVAALPSNLLSYDFLARALIVALRDWIETGREPPPSCYPSRTAGTLVPFAQAKSTFPMIPGAGFPPRENPLHIRDFSVQPPLEGAAYPVFVVATDADGNSLGGVRHPLVQAPLGSHTGWQLRRDGYAGGNLFNLFGAFIPFTKTLAERKAVGDPRAALDERYATQDDWVQGLSLAVLGLVRRRLLLSEDGERLLAAARKSWKVFDAI